MIRNDDSMDVDEPLVRLKANDGKRFTISSTEASCSNTLRLMLETNAATNCVSSEYISLQSIDGQMLALVIDWCRIHCKDHHKWLTNRDRNRSLIDRNRYRIGIDDNTDTGNDTDDEDRTYEQHEPELTDWDKSFLSSFSEEQLLKLTHAANYLDIRSLFSACCRTIAKRWEGKRVDELRRMYSIEGDFSSDEEHQMIQENKKLGFND